MAATMTMRPYPSTYSSWPQQSHQHMASQHTPVVMGSQHIANNTVESSLQPLVATGRKRKRLQRACVACHKAKRRCDGGLPCSNCDFSGRTCSYSDAQGKMVAPTKRTLKPSEAALQEQQQQQHQYSMVSRGPPQMHHSSSMQQQHSGPSPALHAHTSPSTGASYSLSPSADYSTSPRQHTNPLPRIEPSLETRRELLCIFFSHLQPLSSMLDEISFLRDLASNEVPWVLLFAMYAVSAEYANDVHQQQMQTSPSTSINGSTGNINKYSRVTAESGNGSRYASEARKLLYAEDERTGQSMIDGSARVEVAQALALLAFYEFGHRRYFRASSYIQLSSKHVSALSIQGPSMRSDSGAFVSRNTRRLACLLTTMDVSMSMMSGQAMSTRAINIDAIVESPRSGSPKPEDDQETVALTHLRNVSLILNSALEVRQASRSSSSGIDEQIRRCEQDLHHWADDLPRRLQYDQGRLQSVSQLLNSSRASSPSSSSMAPMTKSAAVCWSMMHTVAETTTLILKEVNGSSSDRAKGAFAACNNISILLEQSNPAALPKLFAGLGISVLYSVTSSIFKGKNIDDRDWSRVCDMARSFASYAQLGDSIWSSMASWWTSTSIQLRSPSNLVRRPSPPTSTDIFRRPLSSSPKMSQHRSTSISQHRPSIPSPSSNYHHLPPLSSLSTTLPPLRIPSISSSSDHHHSSHSKRPSWESNHQQQPSIRSLTVDL